MLIPVQRSDRWRRYVGERLKRLWPVIGDVQFDYVWNGYVGMTDDFLPRFHRLGPDAWGWAGCNGRAVGMSVSLGHGFAKAATGVPARVRSEESRVGRECVSTGRSRWLTSHEKKSQQVHN